jgi:uncharacterized protein YjbI with pentapeptide repeats
VLAVLLTAVVIVPPHLIDTHGTTAEQRLKAENDLRSTLLQAIAGAFLLLGLYFTAQTLRLNTRTLEVTREGQITERLTRAIEQLGNEESLDVRLGGIYALERLARDSPTDHGTIMEVLTAFLREHGPESAQGKQATPAAKPGGNGEASPPDGDGQEEAERSLQADSQAVATVLGRRHREYDQEDRLNLDRAHLEGATLTGAHLEGAMLKSAHLERANLGAAHLEGAILDSAHLERANLSAAHLEEAILYRAHLEGATLSGAHLEGATLFVAHLKEAVLIEAHLEGASLSHAHLEGADLSEAHLEGAVLSGAHLEGASLHRAHLERATLRNVHLERAILYGAYLEGADLSGAYLDGALATRSTRWPDQNFDFEERGVHLVEDGEIPG